MITSIQKGLQQIDIFGQTITLNMNKNSNYTTSFGGCSSILIICLMSIIFFSNISDFFNKANVYYESQTTFSNDPEFQLMSDQNAMFALSIDQTNFSQTPFFNITVEQRTYTRSLDGTLKKSNIPIPLQPCTIDRFNNVAKQQQQDIDFTDEFNYLGMNQWLCPAINYTFEIQGTYSSEVFKFIKIAVTECKNNSLNSWSPTCANSTQRDQFLQQEGQFKLQVFQINTMVNPQKSEKYKTMYLDSDMYFSFVPHKLARLANIYYRQYILNNDDSLLPDIIEDKTCIRKAEDFRDLTELGRDTDDVYATVYLRRSPFTELVNRKYQKLGDLLSYLGGFMQILRVVFGFFIAFYNRTSMLIELSNKLYDFKEVTNRSYLRKGAFSQGKNEFSSPEDVNITIKNSPDLQKVEWKQFMEKLLYRSKPVQLNFKILMNQMSCGYYFKNANSKFFTKAMQQINSELDLHNILYQLQEISKLKQILLKKPQLILFNFQPKPLITLAPDNPTPSRLGLTIDTIQHSYIKNKVEHTNEELFLQLQEAYKTVIDEMENDLEMQDYQKIINFKLTKQIDTLIGNLLKNSRISVGKITEINNENGQNEQVDENS